MPAIAYLFGALIANLVYAIVWIILRLVSALVVAVRRRSALKTSDHERHGRN